MPQILTLLDTPGDGYGPSSTAGLQPLLERLIIEQAVRGPVMEPIAGTPPRGPRHMEACALTGFVDLEIGRAWFDNPPRQLVDHVLGCERAGNAILLRPDQVAARNATDGLALLFLGFRVPEGEAAARTHLITAMLDSFRVFHAGYHCPLALHPQGLSPSSDLTLMSIGFRPLDPENRVWGLRLRELEAAPFNMLTALNRRPPPRFGFSPAERDQLFMAMMGATDGELAEEFEVSAETVRKRWRSIFERVSADAELELWPRPDADDARRGPEKRTMLLQYLDTHLEELRPYRRS